MTAIPLERRFRQSLYVSLGLACLSLGYAETEFLPMMAGLTAVTLAVMLVAYRTEDRWQLSIPAANAVGGVIAVGAVAWVVYQFMQPFGATPLDGAWPTALLPFLGPFLMVLIPAKLLRPKHVGDFWGMQGAGLMAVALACAMAGDGVFGLLFLAWLIATVWSLTLFYLHRQGDSADGAGRPALVAVSAGRAAAVMAVGFVLFAVTPRTSEGRWRFEMPGRRATTGIAEERPAIDLNFAGSVSISQDVAFHVRAATADGQPKLDLPANQRWRTTTFNWYENGRWLNRGFSRPHPTPDFPMPRTHRSSLPPEFTEVPRLPDLGPDQYFLDYTPGAGQKPARYIAEPVWLGPPLGGSQIRQPPIETVLPNGRRQRWIATEEGDIFPMEDMSFQKLRYRQVTKPVPKPGLSPPVTINPSLTEHLKSVHGLPALKSWCRGLVEMLVRNGKLPAHAIRPDDPDALPPEDCHEAVALAFEEYLSISGDFKYTLKLQRTDPRLDPVEDFVLHSRQGHCNRFATALALMLRTQGIPSRVVLGYYGADNHNDGTYTVRQSMAHSWAETLVRRPGPDGRVTWHWLTLDASPLNEVGEGNDDQIAKWFSGVQLGTSLFFKSFVIDYNSEKQELARRAVLNWNANWPTPGVARWVGEMAVGGLAFAALGLAGRLAWRRWRPARPAASPYLFDRFRAELADVVGWHPTMTPRDFASAAAAEFARRTEWSAWLDLPENLAELHYRQRYGGEPLGTDEEKRLAEVLAAWRAARTPKGAGEARRSAAAA